MILGRTTSSIQSRTTTERDEAAYEWHMRERLSPQELAEEAGYDPGEPS